MIRGSVCESCRREKAKYIRLLYVNKINSLGCQTFVLSKLNQPVVLGMPRKALFDSFFSCYGSYKGPLSCDISVYASKLSYALLVAFVDREINTIHFRRLTREEILL